MLKFYLAELAQNPKVGMALGGLTTSTGAALKWLDVTKDWLSVTAMAVGLVLSIFALYAQIVRIQNDRRALLAVDAAERRAEAAERRAEEMHKAQLRAIENARNN